MRPSKDATWIDVARVVSERSTCARRKVGCVLTNERGQVLSTGYNGPPAGWQHCTDVPCVGASYPSGEGLDKCVAIHAEANALLQCPDPWSIDRCHVTTAPCVHCVKLLLNTSCREIVFVESYPHAEAARELWWSAGRRWVQLEI